MRHGQRAGQQPGQAAGFQLTLQYANSHATRSRANEQGPMPKRRSVPQQAHRKAVESTIPDAVAYLQEVLGQKLVAHIAGVSDPRTVARWAAGERAPRTEHEQRLRCAYQTFQLLLAGESPQTVRAWFVGLNPELDDQSPAQSIREGQFRDVLVAAKAFNAVG